MKLNLENYSSKSILASYEFVFAQYLGGCTTPPEELKIIPTVYIFGEMLKEIKKEYLLRPDASTVQLHLVEKNVLEQVAEMIHTDKSKLEKYLTININ